MAEFFLSPESERAIERERLLRQQRFAQARTEVRENPQQADRLIAANRLNPQAPRALKEAYSVSSMSDDEFLDLSSRAAQRAPDDGGIGASIGRAVNGVGMGFWNQLVKPAVRGAFTLMDTAAEEIVQRPLTALMAAGPGGGTEGLSVAERFTGMPGRFAEAYQDYGNSPGVIAARNVVDRNPETRFDLGTGLFAGGAAQEESQAQRVLEFEGEQANFGRGISAGLIGEWYSPGDRAYDITAGVAQFAGDVVLDPTAWATAGATSAIAGAKGLHGVRTLGQARRGVSIQRAQDAAAQVEKYGLVSTPRRNTLIFENASHLFGNTKVLEDIADVIRRDPDAAPYVLMRRMKLDRIDRRGNNLAEFLGDLTARTADDQLPDAAEIGRRLIDAAQKGYVKERGFYRGGGRFVPNVKETFRDLRLDGPLEGWAETRYGGINPQRFATAANRMKSATDVDGMLRIAKVPERERAVLVSRVLRVGDNNELMNVVDDAARAIGNKMKDIGVDPEDVKTLLKARRSEMSRQTAYLMDEAGRHSPPPWRANADPNSPEAAASLISHVNKQMVPLFDPQDLRRATTKLSGLRKVYESTGWEMAEYVARGANKYLFKFPTLFTRLAYPIRNNLDNAARTAGAGYHSIFTNPVAWFNVGVRNPKKFREIVLDPDGVARPFDEVARETGALTETASGMWADDGARRLNNYTTYQRSDKGFMRAWQSQLGRMTNDPVARRVASHTGGREELVDSLISDGLVDQIGKELGDDAREFFFQGGLAPNRAKVSEYVDYIEGHIDNLTGGSPGLRELVGTGHINGVSFNDLQQQKRTLQILREQYGDFAPAMTSGDMFIEGGSRARTAWKKASDFWVDIMASRPENRFTRYPLLAQVFADDLARVMPALADDAMRQKLVKAAADAGFDDKHFGQIANAAQASAGRSGALDNLEDVLEAAKMHSTDKMLDIAFDATQRSSFQEMADVIFPFWDAFTEVGTSWGRILRDNPAVMARGGSAYQSARTAGLTYANENGEEVFAFPGGGLLAKALGIHGGSIRLEGRVEGLNLMVQGIGPGFGPMVQWAAGAFLPDEPDLQWMRELVTPFGTSVEKPSDIADVGQLIGDLRPAWMEKVQNAWSEGDIDPNAWNSAVGDAMNVLATNATPEQMADPAFMRDLVKQAEKAGRWTMFVRGALQMGAPTGPQVQWEIETDPDGTTHRVATMVSAYYELLQQTGDQSEAAMAFIDLYGVEPFWIAQGKTKELREGPRTREGFDWLGRRQGAMERHPDVVGYFVPPEDPSDTGDYGVYRQRLERGDIVSLTGEQQLALANQTKAKAIFYNVRQRTENLPSAQKKRILATTRASLDEMFPGWQSDVFGVTGKVDRDRRIELLYDAVEDEQLQDSPVTEPLRAYLYSRQRVMDELARRAESGGASTLTAQANADLKDWLYQRGVSINAKAPDFQGVWQGLLMSEVD